MERLWKVLGLRQVNHTYVLVRCNIALCRLAFE
jgi:hypothetical protein